MSGEKTISEKLIVEAPVISWNSAAVSWRNLPILSATITQLGPNLLSTDVNYLNITVENIYNLPPSFTNSLEYKCGTIIYVDGEITKDVIFENGKWKKFHDVEGKKQWRTLSNLESRAKFTKYDINPNYDDVQNKSGIDLQKIVNADVPRVEWNYVDRHLIRTTGVHAMQQHIEKYRYWPFEIMVRDKNFEDGKEKSENRNEQLYQCYVDLTQLLYPEKTRVRAIAELFTHNVSEMRRKTGFNRNIFPTDSQEMVMDEYNEDVEFILKSNTSSTQNLEIPNNDKNSSFPLTNENGESTFIVIEFELHEPFKKSCSIEDYSKEILELIQNKRPLRPHILTSHLAEDQFSDCIKQLVEIITERYQDDLQCFVQHLHNAGEYTDIRNTLKNKIVTLLDQKFPSDMYSWDTKESQILANNTKDPNAWINYAIFLKKNSETERALECSKEAIALNNQHKIGLLMCGLILVSLQKYREAKVFLESLTAFHPLFAEGWIILHLFYQQIEYHPGLDVTLKTAEKCFKDKKRDNEISLPFFNQPLTWSMSFCKENDPYIVTATMLLKLNLYEFAGLALSQELSLNGRSIPFLYYLSVNYFLQNQHESAISHLKEIESSYGSDFSTSSLTGHCLYKSGKIEDALNNYEYANVTFNRPNNIHFVHLLMGSCYVKKENYDLARKIFLQLCKISPTCETWLGLGIALYHKNQLKEAEMAFNEANQINSRHAVVWGYLCLLNISLHRYDEFSQCYTQASKNNLKNSKLWQTIENAMEKVGYLSPI
ncbi:cilia- and flagella-associated protein 70 [Leptopilina heterotoma]|uniref:cilia- and flagella-associated protein 70 n=1 Tax=Leptopilina heterotoma TaxID=63436 RepID=UPI001CA90EE5|nr:cilia- and flagella-associated protein 70 [Leptopilina heterotoma]